MRYLKNRIDEFKQTNVIDVVLTVPPISNPREWVSKPLRPNGEVDEVKARGFLDKDRSEGFRVVIKPGETVAFGEGSEFNEEQAEYIYRTFGSPDVPLGEPPTYNWLIEVDEDGGEKRGYGSFYDKYRKPVVVVHR